MSAGPSGVAPKRLRKTDVLATLERQGYRCALTGRQLQPDAANIDHAIPLNRGGLFGVPNVQVLHRQANAAKGSMTQEEFIALCREVVAFADAKQAAST
jgi:5-methylcytosine-specific restriction endonuclease McrA